MRTTGIFLCFVCIFLVLPGCRARKEQSNPDFTYQYESRDKKEGAPLPPVPSSQKAVAWAEKLGIALTDSSNLKLLEECAGWLGTPYSYGNCSKSKGTDCSGLANYLYREVYGLSIQRSSNDIYLQCEPITPQQLKEGDLVFFKIGQPKVSHVGVYLSGGKFIHATTQKGVIVSSLDEPYYKRYYYACGRLKASN